MRVLGVGLCLACAAGATLAQETLFVGSKRFTESYILGEIAVQTARATGTQAEHRQGLGNTGIVFAALKSGSTDLYPHYTGTVARELLNPEAPDLKRLNRGLSRMGLGVAVHLGFKHTYALATRDREAQHL